MNPYKILQNQVFQIIFISSIASMLILACYNFWFESKTDKPDIRYNLVIPESKNTTQIQTLAPINFEFTTTFFGDVFWGRGMHNWAQQDELGYEYPFSGLGTFEKQDYEYWIANLECPLTTQTASKYEAETLLKFSCDPGYLESAKDYFDSFSIANNHTDNMEEYDGFKQTKEFLDEYQIDYFGHYDNAIDELCNINKYQAKPIFSDPESQKDFDEYQKLSQIQTPNLEQNQRLFELSEYKNYDMQIPLAMCGYHHVFRLPTDEELQIISKYSEFFPTISMPHQGLEYISQPDNFQKNIFRSMIDLGADAVIGGHTHSILPVETYNQGLIAYSVGNFIFDQQFSKQVTTGLGVSLKWQIPATSQNIVSLNKFQKCQKQDCLELALESKQEKFQSSFQESYIVSDSSNKLTKKADEILTNQILAQIK